MDKKDNLVLVEAIKSLERILKKYGYKHINAGNLNEILQETHYHSKLWYDAFVKKCRINEDSLMYPTARKEFEMLEDIESEHEGYITRLESDYNFVSVMAAAKTIESKLSEKSTAYSQAIAELADKQSKLETYCENVLDSYAEAGVSPFILKSFALNQSVQYADSVEELKNIEERILKLDKKNVTTVSDKNILGNVIDCVEKCTGLKYKDPDDNKEYTRHNYSLNIQKIQEKQDSKIKV